MRYINIGKVNKKFLIPVFGGIFRLIHLFLIGYNPKYQIATKNPFLLTIYTNIGMFLAFIPYIILIYRSKKSKILSDSKSESILNIELIHYDIFVKNRASKYKLIALSSVFDLFQTILSFVFCLKCVYNLWILDIIFISVFSYFILKSKLYKHQYLSMVIILILGLVLNVIEYFKLGEIEDKFDIFEISMKFLMEIFFSITIVIIKYNMEKNYTSPYEICIWAGLFGLILNIIVLIILNRLEVTIDGIKYPDNYFELMNNYDINDFFVCSSQIIIACIYNITIFVTCDYFTPVHILITLIIKEFYNHFQKTVNTLYNILGIITLIFISFTFLIFIEIIELNIFNISYNTKKNIGIRSKIDSSLDINNTNITLSDEVELVEEKIYNPSSEKILENY